MKFQFAIKRGQFIVREIMVRIAIHTVIVVISAEPKT
jgi:hypothetical protein